MQIRPLTEADASAYRALMLQAYTLAADAFTSTAQERAAEPLSWWVHRIADPARLCHGFAAFDAGQSMVGTVAIEYSPKPKTLHKALVIGMYVVPAQRGQGLARALLEMAVAHARARSDVLLVQLGVTQGNLSATRLYESVGFETVGLEPMAIYTGTEFKAKLHMGLHLDGRSNRG